MVKRMLASNTSMLYHRRMNKSEAIALLGGSVAAAAKAVGVTAQAVGQWPDPLPQRIADRVQAALYRIGKRKPARKVAA